MYIWQKQNGFFFQIRPPSYREDLGKGHFRIWLGQLPKKEAKRRATTLATVALEGFRSGMDRDTLNRSLKALADELASLGRDTFAANFSVGGALQALDTLEEGGADPEKISKQRERLSAARAKVQTLTSIRSRLDTIGQALQTDAAALTAERAAYAHALSAVASIQANIAPPAPVPELMPAPVERSEHEDERTITAETLLSVAGKIILDLRREAKGNVGEGGDRYQERLEHALAAFIDVNGDKPLKYYVPAHMQDFANVMAKVPKNRTKHAFLRGLSLRDMGAVNKKRPKPIDTLSESTVKSLCEEIGNLWEKVTSGVEGVRNLKSLKITKPAGTRKAIVREGLPVNSLNIWMKSAAELYPRDDFKKYLPLVGLLTGMRLGELVYLQPKDIVEIDGHTVIDLRLPLLVNGKQEDRSLKTETSPRIVALHPFLTECGFVRWAKQRRVWVFGEFHKARVPADAAGKQMSNWMQKLGIHSEYKHVFHSLRHNAKHWLRTNIEGDTSKHIADKQCGHKPTSVGDAYGFKDLQSDEIAKIEALPLPKGVDFSGFVKK